ncbi:MCE family protein [Streptomyces katsurahamanus]|uniref:MCE family protein n=1 Tax=Streptomyces katsurahamanus TaxID=2577098 RepID=A0ABW9NZJ1_9ACTN|nr:MlaD family protein [Streptomyces katsurahamanus]MQS38733.1 MCE family protein [Streptomyces katsurahamanus]
MITRTIRLKNAAFLVIAVLVLAFVGIRYADLGRYTGLRDYYTVRVQLPRTGGLFTHSDVTYRGVSVGRVGPIELTGNGVEAELRIKDSAPRIPADLEAVVASLSAVGEQYIDLRPHGADGPRLRDGDVIAQRDTRVPAPVTDVLTGIDELASSIDLTALRTVVDEFGTALEGRGDDLEALLDHGGAFIRAADAALPVNTRLMKDADTVLATQAEQSRALRDFADGAGRLAAELSASDRDLRRLIAVTPGAATQLRDLLIDVEPHLSAVLANLLTTSEVAVTRQRGVEELLVTLPALAAAGSTAVTGKGARFGMSATFFEPLPCTAGYGRTAYRNGLDIAPSAAVNTAARCTSPAKSGINVRGSAHAPRGGAVPDPVTASALDLPSLRSAATGLGALLGLEEPR